MKSNQSICIVTSAALALTLALTSCATTGNPREGGIFWSENKAQDRLNERQNKLDNIQGKTRSAQDDSAWTQQKIDAMR